MVDSTRYEEWLKKAYTDLRAAEILYKATGAEELVAFHCQQAVEKYLKAFLIKSTGILHGGHYLMGLLKKCYEQDKYFKDFIHHVAFLNSYYIETRYPQEDGLVVDIEDAQRCIQYAKEITEYKF